MVYLDCHSNLKLTYYASGVTIMAKKRASRKIKQAKKSPIKSTERVVNVKIDNSTEAKLKRKESKVRARKNRVSLMSRRRAWKRKLTAQDKIRIAERAVFTKALRSGASNSEAKALVLDYRKKTHGAGGHTKEQERKIHKEHIKKQHSNVRKSLTNLLAKGKEGYDRAVKNANSIKDPSQRKAAKAKASTGFSKFKATIAAKRKTFQTHKNQELKNLEASEKKEREAKAAKTKRAAAKPKDKIHRKVAVSRVPKKKVVKKKVSKRNNALKDLF